MKGLSNFIASNEGGVCLDDIDIVNLFWNRDEAAVAEMSAKYGNFCFSIANNILSDQRDIEECLNDAYLTVWNTVPPERPTVLSAFLGKILRRICLNKIRNKNAQKRGGGQTALVLDELLDCVPSGKTIDDEFDQKELAAKIGEFVGKLNINDRRIFICRYWYFDSIADISEKFGYSQSKTKTTLHRLRTRLLTYLEKEGVLNDIR